MGTIHTREGNTQRPDAWWDAFYIIGPAVAAVMGVSVNDEGFNESAVVPHAAWARVSAILTMKFAGQLRSGVLIWNEGDTITTILNQIDFSR